MNISGLSFEALPPINIPFRYFLSAPIFALLSAGLVLYSGQDLWLSRWHPNLIAVTHLFTMGIIATVMMGALIQILPVVSGIGFYRVKIIGAICHLLHIVGTLALVANFVVPDKTLLLVAILCLSLGFGLYLFSAINVLIKKLSQGATIVAIRLAVTAMLITAGLGFVLLSRSYGISWISHDKNLTDVHALWGAVGWATMLIFAVSLQIIPMFHVAPPFATLISRYLPAGIFCLLILLSVCFIFFTATKVFVIALLALTSIFGLSAWKVLQQRKRKILDITVRYWQLAFCSLWVAFVLSLVPSSVLPSILQIKYSLLLSAVFGYFFLISIIQGMLLKILPFLSYTHLQQKCLTNFEGMQFLPNMHELLAKNHASYLYYFHIFSGISLLVTILFPFLYWLFAFSLIVEFSWLLLLMIKTVNRYQQSLNKINALSLKTSALN